MLAPRTIGSRLFVAVTALLLFGVAHAGESVEILGGQFNYKLLIQSTLQRTELADSNDNPGNRIARLPEQSLAAELRPDFHFATDTLDIRLSPRAQAQHNQILSGGVKSREWTDSGYINEGEVRLTPNDSIALSAGREVLLWGPAQSYSPSNPFYTDNGRSNPYIELGGKDFFKSTWFPANNWTVSYINNFGKGRSELPPLESFHRARVLKLDHTDEQAYWSINYAWNDEVPAQIGFALQTTLSDALLAYAEGGYSRGRTQYRPEPDGNGGWQLTTPGGDNKLSGLSVLGLAYTLQAGPTVTVEYLYNNQGWDSNEANAYQLLTEYAALNVEQGGSLAGNAMLQLARGVQPGSPLQRRHYVFVQYLHQNLINNFDLTLRLTRNFDDNSMRGVPVIEWRVGDRLKFFALSVFNTGGANTEFGRYVTSQWFVGLNTSF